MLAKLTMKLSSEQITYRKSSNLQGVLFSSIDPGYGEILHNQSMHPYSQYLESRKDGIYWVVNALTEEAYQYMLLPLYSSVNEFRVRGIKEPILITEKSITTFSEEEVMACFKQGPKEIGLEFITPTAFKKNGRFVILPDLRLIFQNLMLKSNAVNGDMADIDEEILSAVTENTFITEHRIRSAYFPMERVFTPGFVGRVSIKCEGEANVAGYVRFLLHFGEYAGVGIKTGMGMGGMKLSEEGRILA